MAQFLNHTNIKKELLNLFKTAEELIFLVSPFIKLNDEMKYALSRKKNDINFEIVVLFGKNEFDLSKSLSKDDMEFFKQFKNVEIFYNPDLHAKFYANESKSIITSLNLHQYSVQNNIEIGVLIERKFIDLTRERKLDTEAFDYIEKVIKNSKIVYEHRTNQERYFFGLFKGEISKEVGYDATKVIYKDSKPGNFGQLKSGFCIRTGKSIPFNIKVPFSKEAYESWVKWRNNNYKEKYCHYSGENSNGQTNFLNPVLEKYSKEAHNLQKKLHGSER